MVACNRNDDDQEHGLCIEVDKDSYKDLTAMAAVQLVLAFSSISLCLLLCWKNVSNAKTLELILEMKVSFTALTFISPTRLGFVLA